MSNQLTATVIADALGAFWNASLGHCHRNQSTSLAVDTIGAIAEGLNAVAEALRASGDVRVIPAELLNYEAPDMSEADSYLIEAALQAGSVMLNDDGTAHAFKQEDLLRLIRCAMNRDFTPLWSPAEQGGA
jgi:hypothetical protein